MMERNKAVLKSTGEIVTILAHDSRAPGAGPGGRFVCQLHRLVEEIISG